MRRFLREHSLTLVFGGLFLAALVGQFFTGHADYNDRQAALGQPLLSLGSYLFSADFLADVAENWQSEYLQFFLYATATVWLVERGSPESKPVEDAGLRPKRTHRWLHENSLGLTVTRPTRAATRAARTSDRSTGCRAESGRRRPAPTRR